MQVRHRAVHYVCALTIGAAINGCHPPQEGADADPPAAAQVGLEIGLRFERRVQRTHQTNYARFLPRSYDEAPGKAWPLIVYLHGGSGRGTDPELLRGSPMVQRLMAEPDFPFVVLVPQCPPGRPGPLGDLWTEHADLVLAILDEMLASYRIDSERIYLIGHSMGGYGAWYLGHRAPERFAALVPMSGPGVTWWAYRIAEAAIPVWVFHGELDQVVPIAESERMVETLRAAGGSVKFTRYPEGQHAIREPFESEELFQWLLEQRRGG